MRVSIAAAEVSHDRRRLLLTALLVYAVCLNPVLTSPITFSSLDAAVSLVDTGRWQVAHADLYGDMDVALAAGRKVLGPPPGLALALAPVYLLWRPLAGPVTTRSGFVAFHVFATLLLAATASALAAGEVAALAAALGAGRAGQLWAGVLFAFGTPAFLFATRLFKENLAALLVVAAFRLAVTPGGTGRRLAAGLLSGAAGVVAYPAALLGPGLAVVVGRQHGRRSMLPVMLGWLPPLGALAAYNTVLFGRPWRFAYSTYLNLSDPVERVAFRLPDAGVLVKSFVHQREGLLLYSPFLVLGVAGLAAAWRAGYRAAVMVAAAFTLALALLTAAWLAQFPGSFTGARYLFAAVPLLAAFAGPVLERVGARVRWALGGASVGLTYLVVQAGHIADPAPLVYAAKTFVSGAGLPVLLKETLPAWLGIETLHTLVSRADVSAGDVLALLATPAGWRLALQHALVQALGAATLAVIALAVRRLWRRPSTPVLAAAAGHAGR